MPAKQSSLPPRDALTERLWDLLDDSATSAPAEQADRLREAHALLDCYGLGSGRFPDAERFEALLGLGAYESAVLALMGDESAFMLSRGANGNCMASAVFADGSEEIMAEGSTLALALLCAHLSSLLADGEKALGESTPYAASMGQWLN